MEFHYLLIYTPKLLPQEVTLTPYVLTVHYVVDKRGAITTHPPSQKKTFFLALP